MPRPQRVPVSVLAVLLLAAAASACGGTSPPPAPPDPFAGVKAELEKFGKRAGTVLEDDAYGDRATRLVYLDQGWGPGETLWYYHADQGSRMLPYDVLLHLEQADSDRMLMAPENMSAYRFLLQQRTPNNPDALPVGFARHDDDVGLTCAACHTSQINYRGTAIRIDGAPALADIVGFFGGVTDATVATLADPAKLTRFTAAMGGDPDRARARLTAARDYLVSYMKANHSTTVEGFGRMDAIGRIVNQVIRFTSGPEHSVEPNAPASIPLLWDAPRHDYVQWTGFAGNAATGPLGRNAGEVIGVFGTVEVERYTDADAAKKGYASSIEGNAIVSMEESLRGLWSPAWPEDILPPIDRAAADRGAALYQSHCASCHALIDRDDPDRRVVAMVTSVDVVGTDGTSANNLADAIIPTGKLEGAVTQDGKGVYGAKDSALRLLVDLVGRSLARQPIAGVRQLALAKLHRMDKVAKQGQYAANSEADPTAELRSYKARPLNGSWASSPYLHNGSVPTLYDLLLPPASRPTRFSVGRWEYDPRKVGHLSDGDVPFVLDTTVAGNSNRGHEYGVELADADRWALVEYLKTL